MNEKTEYAEMLELPVQTCSITYAKPKKKRGRRKKSEADLEKIKDALVTKINNGEQLREDTAENLNVEHAPVDYTAFEGETDQNSENLAPAFIPSELASVNITSGRKKRKFRLNVIAVQFGIIALLTGAIVLSSVLWEGNAIATFFKSAFATEKITVDERGYSAFTVGLPFNDSAMISLDEGVMNITAKGSIYAPCAGKITLLEQVNGKYNIEISHSDSFSTLIKGVDYAYFSLNDSVYSTVPIGYSLGENVQLCFFDSQTLITDYSLDSEQVVWAV